MKNITIAALLMFVSVDALATSELERQMDCIVRSTMFETAASKRDSRQDPKVALYWLSRIAKADTVPLAYRKKIVNLVYFDPHFEGAGGYALRQQMYELCLYGAPPHFKPLK